MSGVMTECSTCHSLFHPKCVGIPVARLPALSASFRCRVSRLSNTMKKYAKLPRRAAFPFWIRMQVINYFRRPTIVLFFRSLDPYLGTGTLARSRCAS
jgi:hypothetical protein